MSYDLCHGHLGNGLTVWNRAKEEHGDYQTIAHIGPDRQITWRSKNLPIEVVEYVMDIAAGTNSAVSVTQPWIKVFHDNSGDAE
jgi:hypothetical protein